ncbi:hypothetical protein, partial [Candidatus Frankia nodulisporulans]
MKPFGITTGQVWAKGLDGQATNRNGVERADLIRGPRSGLGVLDLDVDKGGAASLSALESRVGCLPGTVT